MRHNNILSFLGTNEFHLVGTQEEPEKNESKHDLIEETEKTPDSSNSQTTRSGTSEKMNSWRLPCKVIHCKFGMPLLGTLPNAAKSLFGEFQSTTLAFGSVSNRKSSEINPLEDDHLAIGPAKRKSYLQSPLWSSKSYLSEYIRMVVLNLEKTHFFPNRPPSETYKSREPAPWMRYYQHLIRSH